ncbi:hypothetical protein L6452_28202 [Arctium lappa]|uniref:Uncharacterized protein n=1 Tax=Arctium lappa TaxID=4217 RepID=A0ACB8ZWX1_ARCLA|nr:hypothetical protein L6452_28202 [Arctium lappa]
MKGLCCFFFLSLISIFSFPSLSLSLNKAFTAAITRRHLGLSQDTVSQPFVFEFHIDARLRFPNPRLRMAYAVFQEWKKVIFSDPGNMISNWEGADVCSYNGVFCERAPDDPNSMTVAGIDLNHGDIAGHLAPHLGLLTDLSLFHINSNRFCGIIPTSFSRLTILHELDLSNNRFSGPFPSVVLELPKLKYLDLRFNDFEGQLPPQLFDKDLDAIFVNNNKFSSPIPENFGNSKASVIVFSNNGFKGCIPKSICQMTGLEEAIFSNNEFSGCLPEELGLLENLTVLDFSNNQLVGTLPKGFERLKQIEKLDIGRNQLIGKVVDSVCSLPKLLNFSIADNYFDRLEPTCEKPMKAEFVIDDKENCLSNKPNQKTVEKCSPVVSRPIDCKIACENQNGGRSSDEEQSPSPPSPVQQPPPLPPTPVVPQPDPSPPPTPEVEPPPPPLVESPPPPDQSPPAPVFSPPPPVPVPTPVQEPQPPPGETPGEVQHHIFGFGVHFGHGFFHHFHFHHESQTKVNE